MDARRVELLVVDSTTREGQLGIRTPDGGLFGHIRQALVDAGFKSGTRAFIVPDDSDAAYHAKRADDALDLLRQEQADRREERAARVREATALREELHHLRQGVDVLRGAYLAATSLHPARKRPEIEDWLTADRVREIARTEEADRQAVDRLPLRPDPTDC